MRTARLPRRTWLAAWLQRRLHRAQTDADTIRRCYQAVFHTPEGQQVLNHLLDTVYCTVYEGPDQTQAIVHNARRTVVEEILFNLEEQRDGG